MPPSIPVTPTPENKYFAGLDHLRALAITLVLLFHYRLFAHPAWIDVAGKFGWTGVDLFFVLSGYLISSHLFQQVAKDGRVNLKDFFTRRFFRIIPAYLTVVALYFLVPAFREREALAPIWRYLTFTQNFGLDLRVHGTFSHAWSLCIEEQFYLLLPLGLAVLIYFRAYKAGLWLLACVFAGGFAIRIYAYQHQVAPLAGTDDFVIAWYKYIYYPTYNRLDGLLIGITIAALFQFRPGIKARIDRCGNQLLLVGFGILILAYMVCVDEHTFIASVFGFPLVAIGYGALVAGAVTPSCFLYRYSSGISTQIAKLSFAIYLTHKGVIHITQQQLSKPGITDDGNLMLLLCIVTVLAAAVVLNKIIERPFLAVRKRILKG